MNADWTVTIEVCPRCGHLAHRCDTAGHACSVLTMKVRPGATEMTPCGCPSLPVPKTNMVQTERPMACSMCRTIVAITSSTTAHPEAPEMLSVPLGASIGLVSGDVHPEVVIVCSPDCLRALLRE